MPDTAAVHVAIIGGGPAGLMAAETLARAGIRADIYDAMPSFGRKFLRAGIGGLNITHGEAYELFCSRYGDRQSQLQASLDRFPPDAVRSWVKELGFDTFVGSSGRVFPAEMKAAPLLRAWLHRLRSAGVRLHARHRWLGWHADGALRFSSPPGEIAVKPQATLLALGGASWPQLGSDGAWAPLLQERGVTISPLQSANCGFDVAWSAHIREKFSGAELKSVALTFVDASGRSERKPGEMVVSAHGVEGSLIYAFSRQLRECINSQGSATFMLDLLPGRSLEQVLEQVGHARGSRSVSSHLHSRLGITGIKSALLNEVLRREQFNDVSLLAATIKGLPITVHAARPVAEAISTAGGIAFDSLDRNFMLKNLPGIFAAGEMLDWEAPTGGYLLNACFATGLSAGLGILEWLGCDAPAEEQHS